MADAQAPRPRFEIPLPSKPRGYRPGDGPALAPVCLSLANDTNAFIVDKRILPGEPIDGELKLELYYVIGWPDLPAARVSILATKILDYVSPRTLEDWEYQCSLEKDEEREKQEAGEKKKQGSNKASVVPAPRTPEQKKRGRPSKAEMVARRIAQQASFGDDELANVPLPPARTNGPSLSTPKKGLAQPMVDVADMGETDINEAIYKQLQGGDGKSDSDSQAAEDLEGSEGPNKPDRPETGAAFTSLSAFLPAPSSRGYGEFPAPHLSSPSQQEPTPYTLPVPSSLSVGPKKTVPSSSPKTQLITPVPVPSYPEPHKTSSGSTTKTVTPIPVPSVPFLEPSLPEKPRVATETPVPAPPYPVPDQRPIWLNRPASSNPGSARPRDLNRLSQSQSKHTPIHPSPNLPQRSSKQPLKTTSTPIGTPPRKTPQKTADGLVADKRARQLEYYGFTPASRNHEIKSGSIPMVPSPASHKSQKRKRPGSEEEPEELEEELDDEPEWEVKQLEDDKFIEADGILERYFKVRWVGEWPADQNPTWEPEGNLPRAAVQKYLEDKASASSPKNAKRPKYPLKNELSSDAETSEGDIKPIKAASWRGG